MIPSGPCNNNKKKYKRKHEIVIGCLFVFIAGSHSGRDGTTKFVFFWQKGKVSDVVQKLTTNAGIGSQGVGSKRRI